jgi:hypothetical protein
VYLVTIIVAGHGLQGRVASLSSTAPWKRTVSSTMADWLAKSSRESTPSGDMSR